MPSFAQGGAPTVNTGATAKFPTYTVTLNVPAMASIADSVTIKRKVDHAFRIDAVRWRQGVKAVTTAAKASTAALKISGVAVTNGATGVTIALTSAACTPGGATIASNVSPLALNTGSETDTIEFTFSSTTAFAEGDGWFEVDISNTEGIQ